MSVETASLLVHIVGGYLAAGVLFALLFQTLRVKRVDPDAAEGSLGFRVVVTPGVVALWPLLALRWLRGVDAPPEQRDPHRRAADASADS